MDCANGITWSSARKGVFQMLNIYAHSYQDNHASIHPDCIQIWNGSDQSQLFSDHLTLDHTFTCMTCLETQPIRWRRSNINVRCHVANYVLYLAPGAGPITCAYDGGPNSNLWIDFMGHAWGTSVGTEQLGQAIGNSPASGWPAPYYQILRGGTLNPASPTNNPDFYKGSSSPYGSTQGDVWVPSSPANITERWTCGIPSSGDFAPAAKVGVGYVPVGYA